MNKLDVNTVGTYWAMIFVIAVIIGGSFVLGIGLQMAFTAFIVGICVVGFGTPYAITWFWNKYIAKEEEDEIDYSN